jgi:hypothetical protein
MVGLMRVSAGVKNREDPRLLQLLQPATATRRHRRLVPRWRRPAQLDQPAISRRERETSAFNWARADRAGTRSDSRRCAAAAVISRGITRELREGSPIRQDS